VGSYLIRVLPNTYHAQGNKDHSYLKRAYRNVGFTVLAMRPTNSKRGSQQDNSYGKTEESLTLTLSPSSGSKPLMADCTEADGCNVRRIGSSGCRH